VEVRDVQRVSSKSCVCAIDCAMLLLFWEFWETSMQGFLAATLVREFEFRPRLRWLL